MRYWTRTFDACYADEIDTWDYQLFFTALRTSRLTAVPAVNLVSNTGYRCDATHTKYRNRLAEIATGELGFPLRYPEDVTRDVQADRSTNVLLFARPPLKRIAAGLRRAVWLDRFVEMASEMITRGRT